MKKKTKIIIVIILFIIICSVLMFLFSGMYKVKDVQLLGQSTYSVDELMQLAKIDRNKNIYRININKAQANLKKMSDIKEVVIKRKFPDKLTISLKERTPVASIPFKGGYAIIDEEGLVIKIQQDIKKAKKPIISGITMEKVKLLEQIPVKDKEVVDRILMILKYIDSSNIMENIQNIDLKNTENIKITTNTGILVLVGNSKNLSYKIRFLNKILIDLVSKGITTGTIDMRYDTDPVYRKG